jgi:hypothetical protein
MKKLILLSALLIFACTDDEGNIKIFDIFTYDEFWYVVVPLGLISMAVKRILKDRNAIKKAKKNRLEKEQKNK